MRKSSIQRKKNTKKTTFRHIIVTMLNIKEKKEILRSDKDKNNITFKVVKLAAEFSTELTQARTK